MVTNIFEGVFTVISVKMFNSKNVLLVQYQAEVHWGKLVIFDYLFFLSGSISTVSGVLSKFPDPDLPGSESYFSNRPDSYFCW
jgi:hypothetical protein